ncbi:unnamed protein product [Lampetra fluviatilis]
MAPQRPRERRELFTTLARHADARRPAIPAVRPLSKRESDCFFGLDVGKKPKRANDWSDREENAWRDLVAETHSGKKITQTRTLLELASLEFACEERCSKLVHALQEERWRTPLGRIVVVFYDAARMSWKCAASQWSPPRVSRTPPRAAGPRAATGPTSPFLRPATCLKLYDYFSKARARPDLKGSEPARSEGRATSTLQEKRTRERPRTAAVSRASAAAPLPGFDGCAQNPRGLEHGRWSLRDDRSQCVRSHQQTPQANSAVTLDRTTVGGAGGLGPPQRRAACASSPVGRALQLTPSSASRQRRKQWRRRRVDGRSFAEGGDGCGVTPWTTSPTSPRLDAQTPAEKLRSLASVQSRRLSPRNPRENLPKSSPCQLHAHTDSVIASLSRRDTARDPCLCGNLLLNEHKETKTWP